MPTGDLPRTMMCLADRRLVGAVSPGTRVTAVGILSIFQSKEGESLERRGCSALESPALGTAGAAPFHRCRAPHLLLSPAGP